MKRAFFFTLLLAGCTPLGQGIYEAAEAHCSGYGTDGASRAACMEREVQWRTQTATQVLGGMRWNAPVIAPLPQPGYAAPRNTNCQVIGNQVYCQRY